MKDIITVGMVNCVPLSPEIGEQRVKGYIRALARRGAQLIVFPTLYGIETERVQDAAATYKTAVVFGLAGGSAVLCLADGETTEAADGWKMTDTVWGTVGLVDSLHYTGQVPADVRLAYVPCNDQDYDDFSEHFTKINHFHSYSDRSGEKQFGYTATIETFDLSETEQEGTHE